MTSTGHIGIGPSNTEVGDYVSVIMGGGVPNVLISNGSNWYFVGESYVKGYMRGEALQECQQGSAQMAVLNIM